MKYISEKTFAAEVLLEKLMNGSTKCEMFEYCIAEIYYKKNTCKSHDLALRRNMRFLIAIYRTRENFGEPYR